MSDLIDRQALLKQIDIDSDGEPGYYGDTWKFIDTIKSMPPAALGTNLAEVGTDCISRQAAIEALTEYGNGRAVFISVGEAVIRIEQLPPIQPEPQYKTNYGFMWLCPKCGLPIHSDYTRCVRCGHNREKGV